jgi:cell division protein FtsB
MSTNDSTPSALEMVKDWLTVVVAVITCIAAVIFWVQSSSDVKFEKVESEIKSLKSDIDNIQQNNNEILRIIGRLEGKLDN